MSRVLCASAALLALLFAADVGAARDALSEGFALVFAAPQAGDNFASSLSAAWRAGGRALLAVLGPLLTATAAGALIAGLAQRAASPKIGQRSSADASAPFDLGARVSQLLEPERAIDAAFTGLSLAVLLLVAWLTVGPNVRGVLALPGADLAIAAPQLGELLVLLALRLAVAGLCLGALDYAQRRVRVARRMRATRRELLDEQREQYGDPHVRAERARRMSGASVARPTP